MMMMNEAYNPTSTMAQSNPTCDIFDSDASDVPRYHQSRRTSNGRSSNGIRRVSSMSDYNCHFQSNEDSNSRSWDTRGESERIRNQQLQHNQEMQMREESLQAYANVQNTYCMVQRSLATQSRQRRVSIDEVTNTDGGVSHHGSANGGDARWIANASSFGSKQHQQQSRLRRISSASFAIPTTSPTGSSKHSVTRTAPRRVSGSHLPVSPFDQRPTHTVVSKQQQQRAYRFGSMVPSHVQDSYRRRHAAFVHLRRMQAQAAAVTEQQSNAHAAQTHFTNCKNRMNQTSLSSIDEDYFFQNTVDHQHDNQDDYFDHETIDVNDNYYHHPNSSEVLSMSRNAGVISGREMESAGIELLSPSLLLSSS